MFHFSVRREFHVVRVEKDGAGGERSRFFSAQFPVIRFLFDGVYPAGST